MWGGLGWRTQRRVQTDNTRQGWSLFWHWCEVAHWCKAIFSLKLHFLQHRGFVIFACMYCIIHFSFLCLLSCSGEWVIFFCRTIPGSRKFGLQVELNGALYCALKVLSFFHWWWQSMHCGKCSDIPTEDILLYLIASWKPDSYAFEKEVCLFILNYIIFIPIFNRCTSSLL